MVTGQPQAQAEAQAGVEVLSATDAATYAEWFATLAEPVRVRMLHAVAASPRGITVGTLTKLLRISQSTCSFHVRKLAKAGFIRERKQGTATIVTANEGCCTGLPHAADAVMGLLAHQPQPCRPDTPSAGVTVRALEVGDWAAVRRIYADAITTGIPIGTATFETTVPSRATLDARWLSGHRWVAEINGEIVGWAAASPVSPREYYRGVAETAVYVADRHHSGHDDQEIGTALLHRLSAEADAAGLWMLQASIFTENRAGIAVHHVAGYRTVGVRERIAERNGVWHDTILLERRSSNN